MQHDLRVRLKDIVDRSYAIHIEPGVLLALPHILKRGRVGKRLFIVTDSNVSRLYGRDLLTECSSAGLDPLMLDFPAGEPSKNYKIVYKLQTQLVKHGVRRESLVVALGGGVVGDVAGFVAATVLRGVPYVHIPTTLLSQVDSSVGGKVGIDHPRGKNLIGAFHQPSAVFIDPEVLKTLPAVEFRNGVAEMVKIAIALDKPLFEQIERMCSAVRRRDPLLLGDLIAQSVGLKAAVVAQDEFETGLRKTLNLGHTIGHAIEAASGYAVRHGEAVAIGLAAESRIALAMGLLRKAECRRIISLLDALRLPTTVRQSLNRKKFVNALLVDKKSVGAVPAFVLPGGIGSAIVGVEVPTPLVMQAL